MYYYYFISNVWIIYIFILIRYNDILGQYNKQKDKHTENLNFSYLRLNQQLELMNKKFNVMKQDIDSILKDFSNEGLVNLINELEQNNEKNQWL